MKWNTIRRMCSVLIAALLVMGAGALAEAEFTYPIEGDVVLSIQWEKGSPLEIIPEEYRLFNRLEALTGVTINWIGTSDNLMLSLATGAYPDLWWNVDWLNQATVKPEMALAEGYMVDLTNYIEHLPTYHAYLKENPDVAAQVITEAGQLWSVASIYDPAMRATSGLIIRQDWLDELGLDTPETPREMHDALVAFRDQKGATTPISFQSSYLYSGMLSSGWNTFGNWYIRDGKIQYGIVEEAFKDYVATLAQWYKEGLIDPDMPSATKASVEAAMSNGTAGVVINQYFKIENMVVANKDHPTYKISGIRSLVPEKGAYPEFADPFSKVMSSAGASISGTCEAVEAACRFLDFLFTYEGQMWQGYGVEGYNYELVNGQYVESGILLDPPEGYTKTDILYALKKAGSFPGLSPDGSMHFGYIEPAVQAAKAWADSRMQFDHLAPNLAMSAAEGAAYSQIFTDVDTLVKESIIKFVMGIEPMENWDAFIQNLYAYGLQDCWDIKQAAYDRYLTRAEAGIDAYLK